MPPPEARRKVSMWPLAQLLLEDDEDEATMNPSRCRTAVGKVRRSWIQGGIELYRRKRRPARRSSRSETARRSFRSETIRANLRSDERLIARMEEGDDRWLHVWGPAP